MVGSSRDPYESRVRTHGTPTWRKRNHSRASSFHLPPSSFLPNSEKDRSEAYDRGTKSGKRWREREAVQVPR